MWIIPLLLTSCVTKGSYELVEVQLDATRTALSARNASCFQEAANHAAALDAIKDDFAHLETQHTALSERFAQLTEELAAARAGLAAAVTEPTEGDDGEAVAALVEATVQQVSEALDARSRAGFQATQRAALHKTWETHFASLAAHGELSVVIVNGHTVIRVPTKSLFNEGRVSFSPKGERLLQGLIAVFQAASDTAGVQVVAHTDGRAYHTAEYPSNFELGFAQAMLLVHSFERGGVERSFTAASAGGTEPLGDNETAEGRDQNRRLELVIQQDFSSLAGMEGAALEGLPEGLEGPWEAPEGGEEAPE